MIELLTTIEHGPDTDQLSTLYPTVEAARRSFDSGLRKIATEHGFRVVLDGAGIVTAAEIAVDGRPVRSWIEGFGWDEEEA